jgi:glutathione S-transferase
MPVILYELADRSGRRYSLFSWRTRFALAHKGIPFETRPVRVSDKEAIAFSGQGKVPIVKHEETIVSDSWTIAEYLERTFEEAPSLFGCAAGHGLARFVNAWVDRQLVPKIVPFLFVDLLSAVDEGDAAHLRRNLERVFGRSLEELGAEREQGITGFRRLLDPVRASLRSQPFLCGEAPAYADYILFSPFQWAMTVSEFDPLELDDGLRPWRERMLDLYDGMARREAARRPEAAGAQG